MIESTSLRKTFGETLEKLGGKQKNLVVLDSDLSNSLYSMGFAKSFPDRHFTVGQGENAMLTMAAGMTVRNKIPFVCGENAALTEKGFDSIKNSIAYPNINLKIIGSNYGVSNAEEGCIRQSINDLAMLKALPNLKILTPADHFELKAMLEFMINDFGPTFLRLAKMPLPQLYDQNYQFHLGQPVTINKSDKITIFSYGHMLHECLKVSTELATRGFSSQVINIPCLNPLDPEKILEVCSLSELVVTVEDHSSSGGLGSTIIDILNQHSTNSPKVLKIGLESFPETAVRYDDALSKAGLSAKQIYEKIRDNWLKN